MGTRQLKKVEVKMSCVNKIVFEGIQSDFNLFMVFNVFPLMCLKGVCY